MSDLKSIAFKACGLCATALVGALLAASCSSSNDGNTSGGTGGLGSYGGATSTGGAGPTETRSLVLTPWSPARPSSISPPGKAQLGQARRAHRRHRQVQGGRGQHERAHRERGSHGSRSNLSLKATVTKGEYTGIVFWFAPCVDASAYQGVTLTIGGTVNGAQTKVQSSPTRTIRSALPTTRAGGVKTATNDCNYYYPTATITVPATPTKVDIPWAQFRQRPIGRPDRDGRCRGRRH